MELKTRTENTLATLIERGKRSGSLTYDQVNAALPEGVHDPERLNDILEQLEANGINVIDEDEATEAVEARAVADADTAAVREDEPLFDNEGDGKHIDDPVRMYLTQMGEIPLLTRDKEISLAQKIEVTRRRFRRKVLECDYALRNVFETLKRVSTQRPAVRPHDQGFPDGKPGKRQNPPADAAQPADARTADGTERRRLPAS